MESILSSADENDKQEQREIPFAPACYLDIFLNFSSLISDKTPSSDTPPLPPAAEDRRTSALPLYILCLPEDKFPLLSALLTIPVPADRLSLP